MAPHAGGCAGRQLDLRRLRGVIFIAVLHLYQAELEYREQRVLSDIVVLYGGLCPRRADLRSAVVLHRQEEHLHRTGYVNSDNIANLRCFHNPNPGVQQPATSNPEPFRGRHQHRRLIHRNLRRNRLVHPCHISWSCRYHYRRELAPRGSGRLAAVYVSEWCGHLEVDVWDRDDRDIAASCAQEVYT